MGTRRKFNKELKERLRFANCLRARARRRWRGHWSLHQRPVPAAPGVGDRFLEKRALDSVAHPTCGRGSETAMLFRAIPPRGGLSERFSWEGTQKTCTIVTSRR